MQTSKNISAISNDVRIAKYSYKKIRDVII
jgi:hypothetical protein